MAVVPYQKSIPIFNQFPTVVYQGMNNGRRTIQIPQRSQQSVVFYLAFAQITS
jgi:hypothetical protein